MTDLYRCVSRRECGFLSRGMNRGVFDFWVVSWCSLSCRLPDLEGFVAVHVQRKEGET